MTLLDHDFEELLARWDLHEEGADFVRAVRSSPPARRVESNGSRNTVWRYASHKMGCTISAESTLERTYLAGCEYDDQVVEYWEQPRTISLAYTNKKGRRQRVSYTPDVLVLRRTGPKVVQIKPVSSCQKLVKDRSTRWVRRKGVYEDVAASEYFEKIGLIHEVVTDEDLDQLQAENFLLLLQARRANCHAYDDSFKHAALEAVNESQCMAVDRLMEQLKIDDVTLVLKLIDDGLVVANVGDANLAESSQTYVARSKEELVLAREAQKIFLPCLANGELSVESIPRTQDSITMLKRLQQLDGTVKPDVSERTLRRWRARKRKSGGSPLALVPQTRLRGQRGRRIPDREYNFAVEAIKRHYRTNLGMSMRGAYALYLDDLDEAKRQDPMNAGLEKVSQPTFNKIIKSMRSEEVAMDRGGRRAANAARGPVDASKRVVESTRPFQRVHIDHYKIDQHILLAQVGKVRKTKRPWLTLARDQYSGAILGMSLSFSDPNRIACATVIRDIVRRHKRTPENIVIDNGKDFKSIYFETMLARYGITKHERPPEDPRFGSLIETVFNTFKEEYLRALPGSTSNDERGRSISRSHRGQASAEWSLSDAYEGYERYVWNYYNINPRSGKSFSPSDLVDMGMKKISCAGNPVEYDEEFIVDTAIEFEKKLTVDPLRGIRSKELWYFHPRLARLQSGNKVEARWEPWDSRCLYARVGDAWVACYHGPVRQLTGVRGKGRMFEAIKFIGLGSIRSELETERLRARGEAIKKSKQRATKRREACDRAQLNKGLTNSKKRYLPRVVGTPKPYNHFDD